MASHHALRRLARIMVVPGALAMVVSLAGAALAVVPLTTVAEDPYTNTNAYHKALLEPDTYSYGSTIVGTFSREPASATSASGTQPISEPTTIASNAVGNPSEGTRSASPASRNEMPGRPIAVGSRRAGWPEPRPAPPGSRRS